MAVCQLAFQPWTMTCTDCHKTWDPAPARGSDTPTAASLEREARAHMKQCSGPSTDAHGEGPFMA